MMMKIGTDSAHNASRVALMTDGMPTNLSRSGL